MPRILSARTGPRRTGYALVLGLEQRAEFAVRGEILCFGRWKADCGLPIRWHRNPLTGLEWNAFATWQSALADKNPGDIRTCWEIARFPQAYVLARASSFDPRHGERFADALLSQIQGFVQENPVGYGIHWASGQEIALRLLAWLFAFETMLSNTSVSDTAESLIAEALHAGAGHIERHIGYARFAVYNNHLISEALALYAAGILLDNADATRRRSLGRALLDEASESQFYPDGGYIQQSHNYHRVALQGYLWACLFARSANESPTDSWLRALDRSLDFLYMQQNPDDGRLPNYGSNDGGLPSILSTCDFSDMRPVLQAVSLLIRGERLYDPGPWDESAAWLLGIGSIDRPIRKRQRESVSFAETGYHVLRGNDESTFATFRCGTLRERFSQIDMLHLDVWWKGMNVLVDPGSYQYNAAPSWNEHFMRTASHNSLQLDDRDQMLHYRPFKVLYWTKARLVKFQENEAFTLVVGEHYGYQRYPGRCVHRRSVLHVKDGLWVVVDRVGGSGRHEAKLQWLGGEFPWEVAKDSNGMDLRTAKGVFHVNVLGVDGQPMPSDVCAGAEHPPRGWLRKMSTSLRVRRER